MGLKEVLRPSKENLAYYAMLIPAFVIYIVFYFFPVIRAVELSFFRWRGISPKMRFIGLANYERLFQDPRFYHAFGNTLLLTFGLLVAYLTLSFVLAWFAYKYKRLGAISTSVILFPYIIMPVATGIMWTWIYDPQIGPINNFLRAVGLGFLAREWLADAQVVMPAIILTHIWAGVGFYTIMFLVGLEGIPQSIWDAAKVDGLSEFQTATKVIIPMLKELLAVIVVLCVTSAFKSFALIWTLTEGGPGYASEVVALYLYRAAFSYWRAGYACAIATSLLIIGIIVVIIQLKVIKVKV